MPSLFINNNNKRGTVPDFDVTGFQKALDYVPRDYSPYGAVQIAVTTIIDTPLEFIEVSGIKIAHLPIGVTKSHLDGMIEAWKNSTDTRYKLIRENIFIGKEEWQAATINEMVPQVFGYTIVDDTELAKVITDKKALAEAREMVKVHGIYPTIYVLNLKAKLAHAAYLGGRLLTPREVVNVYKGISGHENLLERSKKIGIPALGCFLPVRKSFVDVGEENYLSIFYLRAVSFDARLLDEPPLINPLASDSDPGLPFEMDDSTPTLVVLGYTEPESPSFTPSPFKRPNNTP